MGNDKINFEIEVKSALIKENRTMSNLAEEIGISVSYLSDIIRGNRKANHYKEKITEILNLENKEEENYTRS